MHSDYDRNGSVGLVSPSPTEGLVNGGEMGAPMRSTDGSQTRLGPVSHEFHLTSCPQLSLVPTDLSRLTTDLASTYRSVVERAGLTFVVDCAPLPTPVWVDPPQWEKIVLTLISNAFKFTFHGEITVALQPQTGDQVRLTVRDTGTGIPAQDLPHIFGRFHRVEGADGRSFEGTGIGLSLVQELVRLHGGAVGVRSLEGEGSSFEVTIPVRPAHAAAERIGEYVPVAVSTSAEGAADLERETAEHVRAEWAADLERETAERVRAEAALETSEEQLREAQKLEAVGRLAGGIAHDFNNLLSVILCYTETALANPALSPSSRAELEEVARAGDRAAQLTRQLLAFSRRQVLDPQILNLNDVLTSHERMLGRVLGEDVVLNMFLDQGVGSVRVDRSQLEQVVMNLVVNARDAMPQGGRLTLETANIELSEDCATDRFEVVPGPYVMLAISDTGSGMDKATQARMFEPFFTTKERVRGTGLGLATVFGIVKQSGGTIWVYSEPGKGTTFKIYFPEVFEDGRPQKAPAEITARPRGSETILVVENEEQVREVARSILANAGYTVLVAASPDEALELVCGREETIDLLITDVIMPKMNGRHLAEHVRANRPDLKVLFMSGYTDDVILHHGVLESGVAFLEKPLTPDLLTRKVRQVLDSPA